MTNNLHLSFSDLPIIIQEKIVRCCSYAELSRVRSVSKHFYRLCAEELNRGYFQLETIIHDLQKQIKVKLPRRESERHKVNPSHSLAILLNLFPASLIDEIRYNLFVGFSNSMVETHFWFIYSKFSLLFLSGSSTSKSSFLFIHIDLF